MSEFEAPKKEYLVFACTRCGKFTYAKMDQLGRKCAICHNSMRVAEMTGEIVKGVSAAAKLANQNNLQWIHAKGVKITKPIFTPKAKSTGKWSLDQNLSETDLHQREFQKLYRSVLTEIRMNQIPPECPWAFFQAVVTRIGGEKVNFTEFVQFLKTLPGIVMTRHSIRVPI